MFFFSNYSEITGYPQYWDFIEKEKDPNYNREEDKEFQEYETEFSNQESYLHSSTPKIIFCQTPLKKEKENTEGLIIDLIAFKDTKELGKLFDIISAIIEQGASIHALDSEKAKNENSNKVDVNEILHLKPNIFGLGINFNYLLHLVNHKLINKKK